MTDISTQNLLRVVGVDRALHTREEIDSAEAELSARAASGDDTQRRKLRRAATICAFLGVLFMLWGAVAGSFMGAALFNEERSADAPAEVRYFNMMFIGTAILESLSGLALLVGGIGLRRLRAWGTQPIIGAILAGITFTVIFTCYWIFSLFTEFGSVGIFKYVMAGFAVLMSAFWCYILWLPLRYFRRVREAGLLDRVA